MLSSRIKYIFIFFIIISVLVNFTSCEDNSYDIEYQEGYPNVLAGNWVAFELQNATVVNGQITYSDNISDYFDLVSALDPNSNDSLVIDNIYDSNIRFKVHYENDKFEVTKGKQLEVINYGRYDIHYVSVVGNYNANEESGEYLTINISGEYRTRYISEDYLTMHIGLYDKYSALFDTMYVVAFRKTGFEDVEF